MAIKEAVIDSKDELLIKIYMRRMDYRHIKEILKYRAKYLGNAEALEILEQLRKNNLNYED